MQLLAQLVVQFMTDPVAGLTEMARVAAGRRCRRVCLGSRRRARAAVAVSGERYGSSTVAANDESELAGVRERRPGRGCSRRSRTAERRGAEPIAVSARTRPSRTWWEPYTIGVGPAGAYVAGLCGRTPRRASRPLPGTASRAAVRDHRRRLVGTRSRPDRRLRAGRAAGASDCRADARWSTRNAQAHPTRRSRPRSGGVRGRRPPPPPAVVRRIVAAATGASTAPRPAPVRTRPLTPREIARNSTSGCMR